LALSTTSVRALEFFTGDDEAPATDPFLDDAVAPASFNSEQSCGHSPCDGACDECAGCGCGATDCGVPVGWISGPYLRAGTAALLSGGILDENQTPGYTISGGYRQPFGPFAPENLFLDLGGSYMSVFGETQRFVSGRQVDFNGDVTITNNFFFSTLNEVQRSSVHLALGWYWGDPIDSPANDPQYRLATRIGGRAGSVRGKFTDVEDTTLFGDATPFYEKTDVFGGVLLGAEAILLFQRGQNCDVKMTLDAEFANDWISFTNYTSGNLTTASLTLGFMLSR
jgi:hypothetical protein